MSIIRPQTPPHVQRVIEKALAKSPADRFKTAEQMRDSLSDEAAGVPTKRAVSQRDYRRAGIAVAAAALVVAGVFGVLRLRSTAGGAATPNVVPRTMVILPFAERGEFAHPLDGTTVSLYLADLLGTADRFRPLSARVINRAADNCQALESICALLTATALQAEFRVYGTLQALDGDSVEIEATIEDAFGELRNMEPIRVRGPRSDGLALMNPVAAGLWIAPTGVADEVLRVATTTAEIEAVPHFLAGEEYFGRWVLDSAEMSYRRALEIDSTLAMAWYRWAIIEDWNMLAFAALGSAQQAEAYSDRLPPRHRSGLAAHRAMIQGDADSAEKIYRQLVEEDENDFEAWAQLGYLLWAYNPRRGRSMAEAVEPLRRALALAPHPQVFSYLGWALAAVPGTGERELAEMDSLIQANATDNPIGVQMVNSLRAARGGDSVALELALDSVSSLGYLDSGFSSRIAAPQFLMLGTLHGRVPDLRLHAQRAISQSDSAYLDSVTLPGEGREHEIRNRRIVGFGRAANSEAGQGRWTQVRSLLGEMETLSSQLPEGAAPIPSAIQMALLATMPLADPVPIRIDSIRAEVDLWARNSARGQRWIVDWRLREHIRLYLHGLLSAVEAEYTAALAVADELETLESPVQESTISQDLAEGVRAEVYMRQGRPADALAALERAPRRAHYGDALQSTFVNGHREAFLRARALQELERYEEALEWFSDGLEPEPAALLAPSHYYRGQIFEATGDTAQAIWHYESFAELWRHADPEYQPKVREVLQHVADLKGDAIDVTAGGG